MASFMISDFKLGLDRRKMNETSLPGALVQCENAHITRGGEIEKSEAFTRFLNLPANTFGLKAIPGGYMVFGSDNITPTLLNSNPPVRYQRLTDSGSPNMTAVLSAGLFGGKMQVIAEFDDNITRQYFDGTLIAAFFSGKARAKFSVTSSGGSAAKNSSGSFVVSDPGEVGDSVVSVSINGVSIISGPVTVVASDDENEDFDLPGAIVDAINLSSNTSGYSAKVEAATKIKISAELPGSASNGFILGITTSAGIVVTNVMDMAGGAAADHVSDVTINGTSIIGSPIDWVDSDIQTAQAIAFAINDKSATSGYTATSFGAEVTVTAVSDGTTANTYAVVVPVTGTLQVLPVTIAMGGGSATPTNIIPGRYVKTIKDKAYTLTGPNLYYSKLDDPTDMAGTGSGFDDISTNTSGAEQLIALASYFNNAAIFAQNVTVIWFLDADPAQNVQLQVLNNTGTIAPDSVQEFGDNDVFYLASSGVRSLRARDASNAAYVNDVGVAIDDIIQAEILANAQNAARAQGTIEPRNGRYWLAIGSTVYVFSFFPTSKISAWSTYAPGFKIDALAFYGQTIVARSGDVLYKVGSTAGKTYDARPSTIITPFHFDKDPAVTKNWIGLDIACEGTWDIYAAFDVLQPDLFEKIATVTGTTFNENGGENGNVPFDGWGTHVALKFVNKSEGYARIGNVELHYNGGEKE